MKKIICKLFGHNWKHRNYKENVSDNYLFLYDAARKCTRCGKVHVSYSKSEEADMYFI